MQFGRGKPSAGAFYDSDFFTIDEALAIGVLNGLQGKNDCRVAIVTMSRPNLDVTGFVDAVERYYRGPAGNFSQVPPVGMRTAGAPGEPTFKTTKNSRVKTVIDTGDPNTLFRNYLQGQYDQNAFFVLAGPATNLVEALDFHGMKDLIAAKSKYLVAALPERAVKADFPAAKRLFAEWPNPVYAVSPELSSLEFPGEKIDTPSSPLTEAVQAYRPLPYKVEAGAMAAALYAGRPKENYFKVSEAGMIVPSASGFLTHNPSPTGKHYTLSLDPAQNEKVVQALIELTNAKPVLRRPFAPVVADDKAGDGKKDNPKDDGKQP